MRATRISTDTIITITATIITIHDVNRHDEQDPRLLPHQRNPDPSGHARHVPGSPALVARCETAACKGLVALAEDPEHPVVIHGVQHVIHVPSSAAALAERGSPQPHRVHRRRSRARHCGKTLQRLPRQPAVDQPDAAALSDNPLSLRR